MISVVQQRRMDDLPLEHAIPRCEGSPVLGLGTDIKFLYYIFEPIFALVGQGVEISVQ
jgi:hypothetical protein